jgi:hypothetical protein
MAVQPICISNLKHPMFKTSKFIRKFLLYSFKSSHCLLKQIGWSRHQMAWQPHLKETILPNKGCPASQFVITGPAIK